VSCTRLERSVAPGKEGSYSQEEFAQEAGLNRAYMGGVERGQRNVGAVNLSRIAEALGMSLAELFAEAESTEPRDD
jgi:transcriptional regulator with XRE-family HTH domain